MPLTIEPRYQQLRTEIARSRRRVDRRAHQLLTGIVRLEPLAALAAARRRPALLVGSLVAGALLRWLFVSRSAQDDRQGASRPTIISWLDRFLRQMRVLLRRWRHSDRSTCEEEPA